MKIINKKGNLFDSKATILCHQVNGMGVMGSGVAKQVKDRYPRVFEMYKKACDSDLFKLGSCQVVAVDETKKKFVANLCGQWNFGYDNKRYTSYDAISNYSWTLGWDSNGFYLQTTSHRVYPHIVVESAFGISYKP